MPKTSPTITSDPLKEFWALHPDADLWQVRGALHVDTKLAAPTPLSDNLDNHVGTTYAGLPVVDLAGVVAHIDSGTTVAVSNGTITYSFTDNSHLVGLYQNPNLGFTAGYGFSPFNAAQRAEARQSIQLWDDLIAPSFVEKNGTGATIQFANSYDPAQAYAYYPGQWAFTSDVFVADPTINTTNAWLGLNGYGATTLVHELGHTLGLSHPGAYNYDPNLDLTYANYAEYAQDSGQYSIMSYWYPEDTGGSARDWSTLQFANAQTPMLHDILTIQTKYGADPTTRAGDTTYGFHSSAGNEVYDFNLNPYPLLSIYDAGGNDTIDLSGFRASVFLDLHQGEFSSAAQAIPTLAEITAARAQLSAILGFTLATRDQAYVNALTGPALALAEAGIKADTGVSGIFATEYMNLSIAYGTQIENGIGGSAKDVIWGNELANRLSGGAGDDVLNGFEGNDVLNGGAGLDQLTGGTGADVFEYNAIEKGDRITDFQRGADHIDLRGTGVDFTWIGDAKFSGHAGELHFAKGFLEGDVNGDKIADLSIYVGGDHLAASDILFA